jgi:hypothetical protein
MTLGVFLGACAEAEEAAAIVRTAMRMAGAGIFMGNSPEKMQPKP